MWTAEVESLTTLGQGWSLPPAPCTQNHFLQSPSFRQPAILSTVKVTALGSGSGRKQWPWEQTDKRSTEASVLAEPRGDEGSLPCHLSHTYVRRQQGGGCQEWVPHSHCAWAPRAKGDPPHCPYPNSHHPRRHEGEHSPSWPSQALGLPMPCLTLPWTSQNLPSAQCLMQRTALAPPCRSEQKLSRSMEMCSGTSHVLDSPTAAASHMGAPQEPGLWGGRTRVAAECPLTWGSHGCAERCPLHHLQ